MRRKRASAQRRWHLRPFNAATSATKTLANGPDVAKVQEWLGHANVSTTRLYDRRKTGLQSLYKKTPPQREPADVGEIISKMVLLLRSEANKYAVSIRTDQTADLPKITGTGATAAGTDEPHAEWYRGDEGDRRSAQGQN
ncbi:hypothetical protein [Tunturibacter empetritectus]|uniref:Tyr recombinase domain-containing protein n=1 Tax=Tunturiibacter empetritectus TaxID=3069691 RepID=A0A7W8MS37_9BACT|nr:hypothetical protein [Edaphobacter lichenicola]MBB5317967.1 hypothetical protein [Edaphobacter lichenicola]